MSRNAFRFGRLAAHDMAALERMIGRGGNAGAPKPQTLEEIVAFRAEQLTDYQDAALAERYRARVARIAEVERSQGAGARGPRRGGGARLPQAARLQGRVRGGAAVHRARPSRRRWASSSRRAASSSSIWRRRCWRAATRRTGEPRKMRVRALDAAGLPPAGQGQSACAARAWDVFGYTAERKLERQMIADYEKLLDEIAERLSPATHATAVALAAPAAGHQGLRPHQGAQLQGRQGARGGAAGRAAQPLADRAQGGGVGVRPSGSDSIAPAPVA